MEKINDKNLEQVAGGMDTGPVDDYGLITVSVAWSSSGDTPKYYIGQNLKIAYKLAGKRYMCDCEVRDVSATKDRGLIFKEFGYKVLITGIPEEVFKCENIMWKTYNGVYESCLFTN